MVPLFSHAVVLTGGIATGKSSAAHILRGLGFETIDADEVAHEILNEESAEIARLFGEAYVQRGEVDRRALGALVFGDGNKRASLEALLHPLIKKKIASLARQLDLRGKTYLVEIPLFFEKGGYAIVRSIVVYAPKSVQLKRLMQRNDFTKAEAMMRIETQMDIEEKRSLATFVLDNSGSPALLEQSCKELSNLL